MEKKTLSTLSKIAAIIACIVAVLSYFNIYPSCYRQNKDNNAENQRDVLNSTEDIDKRAKNTSNVKIISEQSSLIENESEYESTSSSNSQPGSSKGTHDYVDLGLSINWATCNVGANNPEDIGEEFAWGEIKPKSSYSWENYKFRVSGGEFSESNLKLSKYAARGYFGNNDNLVVLQQSDDVAYVSWSEGWRMPSKADFEELLKNCTCLMTTRNGIEGFILTSNKVGYRDKSIFFPALEKFHNTGYWSSSLTSVNPSRAWYFTFGSKDSPYMGTTYRYKGQLVRPVYKK